MVKIADLKNAEKSEEVFSSDEDSNFLEDLGGTDDFHKLFLGHVDKELKEKGSIDISKVKIREKDGSFISEKDIKDQMVTNASYNAGYVDALQFVKAFFQQSSDLK